MSTAVIQPLSHDLVLPWSPDPEQEALFIRWLKRGAIALLVLFILIPWLPVFEAEYVAPEKEVVKTKVVLEDVRPIKKKPKAQPEKKLKQAKKKSQSIKNKAPGKGGEFKARQDLKPVAGISRS